MRRLPRTHATRPRHARRDDFPLRVCEPARALFVAQKLKRGLLVQRLAAGRADEAPTPFAVGTPQRVRLAAASEQLVDDDALVDYVDAEVAAAQAPPVVLKLVRGADDCRHAARGKVVTEQKELVLGRKPLPVH